MGCVLVTGGAGYIGSHAVKALRHAGHDVVVLDNLVAGHREAVAGVPFVHADIADTETVRDTIRQYEVSAVMHFAALLAVGESVLHPSKYYRVNVGGTLSLLDAMVSESVGYLVFSSTCAIFGNPIETPIPENHPTRPINAYGETKLAVERALEHYERAYGITSIKFRYFNAAGADPDGQIGEDHSPEIHLIPNAIRAAEQGEALEIYGDDYPTPDGTCQRDYVHVSDLSSAHLLALEALQAGAASTAYNLGNGRPHSVREVISAVERVSGSKVRAQIGGRRAGDPAVLYAASDRVKQELGWAPQFEDIDAIVGTALRWHRSHPDGFARASATAGLHLTNPEVARTMKKRIVITGAAGFIGSHLSDALLAQGHSVVGIDNLLTGSTNNISHLVNQDFLFLHHDVTNYIFIDGPVDVVLHWASPASPIDYLELPIPTLKVGALGTHKALGLAKAKGATFVLASTSEVYGDPLEHPQKETYWGNVNPIGPRGVYDEAKRFAEAMTTAYHRYHAVDTKIVRIFNTYGPRMRIRDGRAVPNFIAQALRGEDVTIYGDGQQTRSFCYISDLVDGICRLMVSDTNGPVNIGNPTESTIEEIATKIIQMTKSSSRLVYNPLPEDDPKVRKPDITRARELLQWEPRVGLEEGLESTIEYFMSKVDQPSLGTPVAKPVA